MDSLLFSLVGRSNFLSSLPTKAQTLAREVLQLVDEGRDVKLDLLKRSDFFKDIDWGKVTGQTERVFDIYTPSLIYLMHTIIALPIV